MSQSVFITGASRGLGRALAIEFSRDKARVGLLARGSEDLERCRTLCLETGASEVITYTADVRDSDHMSHIILGFAERAGLDLCFANAGILREDQSVVLQRDVFETNFYGCVNTVVPAIQAMRPRGGGTIVVLSSFSAYRGVPTIPTYAASKAALSNYAESVRFLAAPDSVGIKTAVLGYLDTELGCTSGLRRHLVTDVSTAARQLRAFALSNAPCFAYPVTLKWLYRLIRLMPPRAYDWVLRRRYRRLHDHAY